MQNLSPLIFPLLLLIISFTAIPKSFCQAPEPSPAPSRRRSAPPPATTPSRKTSPAPSRTPSPKTSPAPSRKTSPPRTPSPKTSPPPSTTPSPSTSPTPSPSPLNTSVSGKITIGNGKGKGAAKRWIIIGIIVGFTALMIIGVLAYFLIKKNPYWEAVIKMWKLDDVKNQLVEEFMKNYGSIAPKLYSFTEIKKMTRSFSDKLGCGGFGCVYKGKLLDGRAIAVKVLDNNQGNGEDFINEVAAISRTFHINVVSLLGFSYNSKKRALIYEFMPNGSLDKFISKDGTFGLEWKLLYEITLGIASGLDYLHRGCSTRIVHLDIKPQNILLDAKFCPKISDFGLAGLCKNRQSILSTMGTRGTIGYIAPEVFCRNFGGISHKSDVYSYGMMILEMVGLRTKVLIDSQEGSETYFPDWIYEHVELGRELPLEGVTSEEEKETVMKMIYVGLWCIQTNPWDRPSISKVVEMLEDSFQSLQMPPKPYLGSAPVMNSDQRSWSTSSIS